MTPKANQLQAWYAHIKRQLEEIEALADEVAGETDRGDDAKVSLPIAWPTMCESLDDVIAYMTLMRGIIANTGYDVEPADDEGGLAITAIVEGEANADLVTWDDLDEIATERAQEAALWR